MAGEVYYKGQTEQTVGRGGRVLLNAPTTRKILCDPREVLINLQGKGLWHGRVQLFLLGWMFLVFGDY